MIQTEVSGVDGAAYFLRPSLCIWQTRQVTRNGETRKRSCAEPHLAVDRRVNGMISAEWYSCASLLHIHWRVCEIKAEKAWGSWCKTFRSRHIPHGFARHFGDRWRKLCREAISPLQNCLYIPFSQDNIYNLFRSVPRSRTITGL